MSYAIGIDAGGTKVLGGVVDETGKILATARKDTPRQGGKALTQTIADTALELMAQFEVTSIGVSATFDLSLWMNDFLIKHVDKISYVTTTPNFSIQSLENGFLAEKVVSVESKTFNSDKELDEFFENQIGKKIVLYTIGKFINLSNMAISYELRYADITLKSEQREIKLNKILK
jgi:hypothetical protein